ncbi:MAG: BolA-like protein family [Candidatus Tokpelaia hoelldobleri]|uniref:BolA-like protein family n=1 Tax=Candidatus Tokpelaia hoelldobleri TaxID=1902579 RepID=A0A1U9JWN2_9HYPH|nr:MAG: BolA-like protein family [Candidatus Tokpelaia hoelldoblerii]
MSSTVQAIIERKLQAAFHPDALDVINESHKHAGHHHDDGTSFDGTGETHFRVRIVAQSFATMKRVERHRAITRTLADELQGSVHALAIEARAPNEWI